MRRGASPGSLSIAMATLVSGPSAQSVTLPSGRLHHEVDDGIDGVGGCERPGRLGQRDAVEAGLAVHVLGRLQDARERAGAAGVHGHRGVAGKLHELAGVALGEGQRDVAGDRGDGQGLDLVGRGQGQEDRDRVVLAGVAVDDDAVRRHPQPSVSLNSIRRLRR